MNKIWLIIKREYLTRVRKRSFLVTTFLVPVFFAALIVTPGLMMMDKSNDERIAVVDESGLFKDRLRDADGVYYKYQQDTRIDSIRVHFKDKGFTGVLYLPAFEMDRISTLNVQYYSQGQPGLTLQAKLNSDVTNAVEDLRMEKAGIDKEKLNSIRTDIRVTPVNAAGQQGSAGVAFGVGYGSGFLIYMVLILFGMQVMRGVSEEKTSRIAEVMISSVKPFQLMMGKILGVGAVGLTQFLIWIGLTTFFWTLALPAIIGHAAADAAVASSPQMANMQQMMNHIGDGMKAVNAPLLIVCFVFYFLGGYLFYAALFAAVGSLVNEDANEAQSMTLPVTMPVIVALFIMFKAVSKPTSALAVWGSIIPFTSPVVMMARLPYGMPGTVTWVQLILSILLLILGFLGTTWVAGKIYRTGILMYGKKITWGEAVKWIFRKS